MHLAIPVDGTLDSNFWLFAPMFLKRIMVSSVHRNSQQTVEAAPDEKRTHTAC
jgi:hypothetical protein